MFLLGRWLWWGCVLSFRKTNGTNCGSLDGPTGPGHRRRPAETDGPSPAAGPPRTTECTAQAGVGAAGEGVLLPFGAVGGGRDGTEGLPPTQTCSLGALRRARLPLRPQPWPPPSSPLPVLTVSPAHLCLQCVTKGKLNTVNTAVCPPEHLLTPWTRGEKRRRGGGQSGRFCSCVPPPPDLPRGLGRGRWGQAGGTGSRRARERALVRAAPGTVLRGWPLPLPLCHFSPSPHTQRSSPRPFPAAKENSLTDPSPEALLGQASAGQPT